MPNVSNAQGKMGNLADCVEASFIIMLFWSSAGTCAECYSKRRSWFWLSICAFDSAPCLQIDFTCTTKSNSRFPLHWILRTWELKKDEMDCSFIVCMKASLITFCEGERCRPVRRDNLLRSMQTGHGNILAWQEQINQLVSTRISAKFYLIKIPKSPKTQNPQHRSILKKITSSSVRHWSMLYCRYRIVKLFSKRERIAIFRVSIIPSVFFIIIK